MKDLRLPFTTSAGGAATVNSTQAVYGKLYAIEYQPGDADTGADLTITCEDVGSKPLLTVTNAGTAVAWWYPRDLVHAVADASALTGTNGGDRDLPLLNGKPKLVVAQGGNAKTGVVILHYE